MLISLLCMFWVWGGDPAKTSEPEPYHSSTGRFSHEQLQAYAKQYQTPLYVYDGDLIQKKYRTLAAGYSAQFDQLKILYAVKANTNMAIISLLKKEGAGAECISGGELQTALKLGFRGEDILFTSSAKTREELVLAINNGIVINLDSFGDIDHVKKIAAELKKKARVSVRINPDVDPHTHRFISTGHKFSKFGVLLEEDQVMDAYKQIKASEWVEIWGLHSHIGSQILEALPFEQNAGVLLKFIKRLKDELGIQLKFVDLGGGIGIPYHDGQDPLEPAALAKKVAEVLKPGFEMLGYTPEIWLEPGRYLVADSGILLASVISVKDTPYTDFVNVNTGFNHLVRPILYEAYHRIRVLGRSEEVRLFDVAGNICETGDILGHDRLLPTPKDGDTIAILDTGAYGFSMASAYNSFDLPAEILVRGDKVDLIRERTNLEDLFRHQKLPADLKP